MPTFRMASIALHGPDFAAVSRLARRSGLYHTRSNDWFLDVSYCVETDKRKVAAEFQTNFVRSNVNKSSRTQRARKSQLIAGPCDDCLARTREGQRESNTLSPAVKRLVPWKAVVK